MGKDEEDGKNNTFITPSHFLYRIQAKPPAHYLRHRWLSLTAKVHRKAFRSEPLNSKAVND